MKNTYTIGLKVLIAVIGLGLLHTASNILDGFGLISDLFTVLGAYQVWLRINTKEARQESLDKISQVVNVDDIGELIAEKVEEVRQEFNQRKASVLVDDLVQQQEEPLITPLNYSTKVEPVSTNKTFEDGSGI